MSSAGQEVIDLALAAGLVLDPWQQLVLELALREDRDGQWAAFEVACVVARQNGKGGIIEARELGGLFLLGEQLIVHTAHQFDTSMEAFRRLLFLIEDDPELDRQVKRVSRAHGEEGIELLTGQRIKFKTRTKSGGRGFSGDCVILDEAMILSKQSMGALMPTMSAKPNPQLWYMGSAVDADIHDAGLVFAQIRERGLTGRDPSLCFVEWSPPADADPDDPRTWAQANPGMGIRISPDYIANERRSLDDRTFAVERLSIGNWPRPDQDQVEKALDPDRWAVLVEQAPLLGRSVCVAIDMSPDRKWLSIAAASLTVAGKVHVEVGYHDVPSTSAVIGIIVSLVGRWDPCAVVLDKTSPAASLIPDLRKAGIEPEVTSAAQMAQACGGMHDAVRDGTVSHTGDPLLASAVKGAAKRTLSGAWAFTRIGTAVISPLVAVTLARFGLMTYDTAINPPPPPQVGTEAGAGGALTAGLMTTGF